MIMRLLVHCTGCNNSRSFAYLVCSFQLSGGEKGIPLQLVIDTHSFTGGSSTLGRHLHHAACNVKVFKDKGGDRRQKQDQQKLEKLPPHELTKFHTSQSVTRFTSLSLPVLTPSKFPATCSSLPPTPQSGKHGLVDSVSFVCVGGRGGACILA